jgi:hypothetical protein
MLRTILTIVCDDCGEQFRYARVSEANSGPSSIDVSALTATALAKPYWWTTIQDEKCRRHYCLDCSYNYQDLPDDAMST